MIGVQQMDITLDRFLDLETYVDHPGSIFILTGSLSSSDMATPGHAHRNSRRIYTAPHLCDDGDVSRMVGVARAAQRHRTYYI